MTDPQRAIPESGLFVATMKAALEAGYSYANLPAEDRIVVFRPDGSELWVFRRAAWNSDSAAVKLAFLTNIVGIVPADVTTPVSVRED